MKKPFILSFFIFILLKYKTLTTINCESLVELHWGCWNGTAVEPILFKYHGCFVMVWMIVDSSVTIASEKQRMFLSLKNCNILLDKTQKKGYKKELRQETQTLKWVALGLTGSLGGAGNWTQITWVWVLGSEDHFKMF